MKQVFHSRPAVEGPRSGAHVAAELQLDQRAAGVRAIDQEWSRSRAPARVAAPHWERGRSRRTAYRVPSVPAAPLPPPQPSAVYERPTDPLWIRPPEEPAEETLPANFGPVVLLAPIWQRAAGWLIDAGLVATTGFVACLAGATAYGWRALLPWLSRGLDDVLDGLVFGRSLWVFVLALMMVVSFAYATVSQALAGMTLGQRVIGLRMETKDGEALSFSQSAWRAGLSIVGFVLGGLGPVWALFDAQHLSLHDRLVGTRVVRDPPEEAPEFQDVDESDVVEEFATEEQTAPVEDEQA